MGTRSLIGRENHDGTVTYIYCHWDGYLSNNGKKLNDHYLEADKVGALMALGDISSLGSEIGEKHPFDTYSLSADQQARYENWTSAYGRDRGEQGVEAKTAASRQEYLKTDIGTEYWYLFVAGQWLYDNGEGRLRPLAPALNRPDPDADEDDDPSMDPSAEETGTAANNLTEPAASPSRGGSSSPAAVWL